MITHASLSTPTPQGVVTLRRWTECPPDLCQRIHRVCLESPSYFLSTEGRLPDPESIELWFSEEELPWGCTREHHFVYGILLDEEVIGIAHVLAGCRDPAQATIGLLLLSEKHQGQGLGRAVYELIQRQIVDWQMTSCRIGVVANNAGGLAFWRAMGFVTVGEMAAMDGFLDKTVFMEKSCGPAAA
jgi:GNAT superfamily N-acetyltransferase